MIIQYNYKIFYVLRMWSKIFTCETSLFYVLNYLNFGLLSWEFFASYLINRKCILFIIYLSIIDLLLIYYLVIYLSSQIWLAILR